VWNELNMKTGRGWFLSNYDDLFLSVMFYHISTISNTLTNRLILLKEPSNFVVTHWHIIIWYLTV
jgi:hypothetical protein